MTTAAKIALVVLTGCAVGFAASCTAILDFTPDPSQCWCGEQWRVQIAGATAYNIGDDQAEIPASATTYTRCVSMLEHLALDAAEPQDPVYIALRDAFQSESIANCELAGAAQWQGDFDHTDCAMTGMGPVSTNLVHLGPCWADEQLQADPPETCPLEDQCGPFYDCSQDPIILYHGQVQEGETGGEEGEDGLLWSCDETVRANIQDAQALRL